MWWKHEELKLEHRGEEGTTPRYKSVFNYEIFLRGWMYPNDYVCG